MPNLPLDLLEEDELLAEFHRAGIFLPDEEHLREHVYPGKMWFLEEVRKTIPNSGPIEDWMRAQYEHDLHRHHLQNSSNMTQYNPVGGLFGGLTRGIFGNF